NEAARRFAGRIAADIAAHRQAAQTARARADEQTARAEQAAGRSRKLERDRLEQAAEQAQLKRQLATLEEALVDLREQGTLGRGETIVAALARLAAEQQTAEARASELQELVEESETRRGELERQAGDTGREA